RRARARRPRALSRDLQWLCFDKRPSTRSQRATRITAESCPLLGSHALLLQPLLEPLDRIVASEEFLVANQGLMERDGGLHSFDHELFEGPAQAHDAAF